MYFSLESNHFYKTCYQPPHAHFPLSRRIYFYFPVVVVFCFYLSLSNIFMECYFLAFLVLGINWLSTVEIRILLFPSLNYTNFQL